MTFETIKCLPRTGPLESDPFYGIGYMQRETIWKILYKQFRMGANSLSTAQKLKFSIKDFFRECDQVRRKLRISSHLLKKSLMECFLFCAVKIALREPDPYMKQQCLQW